MAEIEPRLFMLSQSRMPIDIRDTLVRCPYLLKKKKTFMLAASEVAGAYAI